MDNARQRLIGLDSCAVSDAMDQVGLNGVLTSLRGLSATRRIVGRAVTVELVAWSASQTPSPWHLGTRAIELAGPGDVIVVQHGGPDGVAGWGGLLSVAAKTAGVEGVVVGGSVRDVDEAVDVDFPVFATSATPRTARGRVVERATNETIHIDGVEIRVGDLVIADRSGIVVIPQDHEAEVLAAAERIAERESRMAADLRKGDPPTSVLGRSYELMLTKEHTDE